MSYLTELKDPAILAPGDIVRRTGDGKEQQGCFVRLDENSGLIVGDVVDLAGNNFAAEVGVLRINPGDTLCRLDRRFASDQESLSARAIVTGWSLFKDVPALQKQILIFVERVYSPSQILELDKSGSLQTLFVPIQQKFKIGKFKEKIDWEKIRDQRFRDLLESLHEEKHITYLAFIPGEQSHKPLFYSIGTKPHQETNVNLQRETFAFKPTHGGHIKIVSPREATQKKFVVDAGSNFIGAGTYTSLPTAEMITNALHELFPEHEFVPLAGRGAHGAQSY